MKILLQSIYSFLFFMILTGLIYPLVLTIFFQEVFPVQSNGSLILKDGKVIGSELIGQMFTNDLYFQGRPSASLYDATNSSAYNYGPASSNLLIMVSNNAVSARKSNGIPAGSPLPADMVTASASGLDPDISIDNALLQAGRIAGSRHIPVEKVKAIIMENCERSVSGFWGVDKVNVLKLNLALGKTSR